jgi:hypothetical protein
MGWWTVNRHTAGALIGWGSFLAVASFFAVVLTVARFEWWAGALIGVVVGGIVAIASRHGVDRTWPTGITEPDDDRFDVDLDGLLDVVRLDKDTPATWRDLRSPMPTADETVIYDRTKLGPLDRQQPGSRRVRAR